MPQGGNAHPTYDRNLSLQIDQLQAAINEAERTNQWARKTALKARLAQLLRKVPS